MVTGTVEPVAPWQEGNQPPAARPAGLPASVLAAGVILIVVAVLIGLFAALVVLGVALIGSIDDPSAFGPGFEDMNQAQLQASMGMVWGVFAVMALIALIVAGAHLVGGIGILRRRSWGRITGLVLSFLALLLILIGLGSVLASFGSPMTIPDSGGFTDAELRQIATSTQLVGLVFNVIFLAAYGFVAAVLLRRGDVFT